MISETTDTLETAIDFRLLSHDVYQSVEQLGLPELDDEQRAALYTLLRFTYGAGYSDRHQEQTGETLYRELRLIDPARA